jgi:hypothetical protein
VTEPRRPAGPPDGGDLAHWAAQQVVQGQHLGLTAGQAPDRPPHLSGRRRRLGDVCWAAGRHADHRAALGQPPADGGGGQVGDHPADPAGRLLVAADPGPLPPGRQERLLSELLGDEAAARQGPRQGDRGRVLPQVELVEALDGVQRAQDSRPGGSPCPRLTAAHRLPLRRASTSNSRGATHRGISSSTQTSPSPRCDPSTPRPHPARLISMGLSDSPRSASSSDADVARRPASGS